ncbi:MAG: hypothetical protein V3V03_02715 [Hyphomonadaceae bacterium]
MSETIKTPISGNLKARTAASSSPLSHLGIFKNARAVAILALILLAVSAIAMVVFTNNALRTYRLSVASDADIQIILATDEELNRSAAYHELLSERAAALEVPDAFSARLHVEKALEINPNSPYAWAHLAYLDTYIANGVTPKAVEALTQSIERCQYCDAELGKWRLQYILSNWNDLPFELKEEARQQARLLKADPREHPYLRDVLIRARLQGFDLGIETHELRVP